MERGGQGGRRRALARLLKGEGGVASQGRSSRLITFYLVTEPPDDMPDLECEEVRLKIMDEGTVKKQKKPKCRLF
jgi:hypothetical protein